jgi:phenylacetyl-CoA:acceptor oxidoreductase subunit 1
MPLKTKLVSRRDFLRSASQIGISAVTLAGVLQVVGKLARAQASEREEGEAGHHWVMVIDLGACIGCNYCTYACKAVNDTAPQIMWNTVFADETTFSRPVFIPRPCMHCEDAPCVEVCPVSATYHRADGLVAMDYDRCIGCRYCQVACPYGARYFNWEMNTSSNAMVPEWGSPEVDRRPRGVIEKCTFCAQRIDAGLAAGKTPGVDPEATPACVNVCPVGARHFGDLNDPDSRVSRLLAARESLQLREEIGTHPRVYYLLPERST